MMALLSGLFRRVGRDSRKVVLTFSRSASDPASSTDKTSSRTTLSPLDPVIDVKAMASRKPVAVFSNLPLAF